MDHLFQGSTTGVYYKAEYMWEGTVAHWLQLPDVFWGILCRAKQFFFFSSSYLQQELNWTAEVLATVGPMK